MKITLKILRSLIRETLYTGSAPKRLNLPDVEIEADNTREAGERAAEKYFKQHRISVDPMTVSLTPKDGKKKGMNIKNLRVNDIVELDRDASDEYDDDDNLIPSEKLLRLKIRDLNPVDSPGMIATSLIPQHQSEPVDSDGFAIEITTYIYPDSIVNVVRN